MSERTKPQLTIFTPSWNRADLLPRLFRSIAKQADKVGVVEWLVIDDGSTDETGNVMAGFSSKRPDLVRYIRVENGGKHRAINRAAHEARADWIMLVDSDDEVAEGAISDVLSIIEKYHCKTSVGLIRGLSSFPEVGGQVFSFRPPCNPCYHWQWASAQKTFDSAHIFRRSALALHPFPEYEAERFMAEGWLYCDMDKTHEVLFVNRAWVNCWYQPGGLSDSALRVRLRSLRSTLDVYTSIRDSPAHWRVRARASVNWWRYWLHWRDTGAAAPQRILSPFALVGWMLYSRDRLKMVKERAR